MALLNMAASAEGLRVSTVIQNETVKYLQTLNVNYGEPIMAEKRGHRPLGTVDLVTNVYGLMMTQRNIYRYHVKINIFRVADGRETEVDLTKSHKGDYLTAEARQRCRDIIVAFKAQQEGNFLHERRCIYYDLQSILFSIDKLDIDGSSRTFTLDKGELPSSLAYYDRCVVDIRKVEESVSVVELGKLSAISRNLLELDYSIQQFLDIATSQYIFFHPEEHLSFSSQSSYLLDPQSYGLSSDDLAYFDDTFSYLSFGAQKAIRMIEGPAKTMTASVIVESKKTAFHYNGSLYEKVVRLLGQAKLGQEFSSDERGKLAKFLKGLVVEVTHTRNPQRFEIKELSAENATNKTFLLEDREVSIQQYFQQAYNIELKQPLWPLLVRKTRDGSKHYPIEVCTVCDNQRVKTNQQTSRMVQIAIKKCAVAPAVLRRQSELCARSLHLWDSEWLKSADIRVIDHPLQVAARALAPPDLEFREGVTRVNPDQFVWRGRQFLSPASCRIWAAYAFVDSRDRFSFNEFEKFLMVYVQEANAKGMKLADPSDYDLFPARFETIDERFRLAADANCEFILVVHADLVAGDAVHAGVKYAERRYSIPTQCIRVGTVNNVNTKNQRLTLGNIVNKSNVKLGGINYSISITNRAAQDVLGSNTLYIGMAMNHPAGGFGMSNDGAAGDAPSGVQTMGGSCDGGAPSVVGYAANIGYNSFDFSGDFFYQEPRREEKANIVVDVVSRCLEFYEKTHNCKPSRLVMYRSGCSEGQFRTVLQFELPLIKHILKENRCDACVTIIVVNKLQNIRFFKKEINPNDRAPDQNIKPGVVVDHTVVHPEFAEFFLNSHRALQGTTRTPKYSVLHDDSQLTLAEWEGITFQLCFGHQIVYMPTSVPSPVYIANRYAERGRILFQQWMKYDRKDGITFHDLTDTLCFYYSKEKFLYGRRVNA